MKQKGFRKVGSIIGGILCAIFLFLLVCNVTIIVKGTLHPETPPRVLGVAPMVVLSGSMSGSAEDHIEVGDLIFAKKPDIAALEEGDVVSYMEDGTVITHRIVEIYTETDGTLRYITKGDANNVADPPITAEAIIGTYWFRIPRLGDFAMFLQQPIGMAVFIGIPVCVFILWDIFRRNRSKSREAAENAQLRAELESLRAAAEKTDNKTN